MSLLFLALYGKICTMLFSKGRRKMTSANKTLTDRESTSINIIKAISILSVIAAHTISFSPVNLFSEIISSFWVLFGEVGVIAFFVVGGFLYSRKPHDGKIFWKKKFFRIVVPWFICSLLTYLLTALLNGFNVSYFKWILGSGTWYYYITIYTLFIFIFKWLYDKDAILWLLIVAQIVSLTLASFGISTTIPLGFFTDYLNPLNWIGYFSFGILIRKYRFDLMLRKQKFIIIISCVLALFLFWILSSKKIFTYFNLLSFLFCLSSFIIITAISYKLATIKNVKYIGTIGTWSYCIYLLHMQIVQFVVRKIPDGWFKLMFSPFIGLIIMIILIIIGLYVCKRIPFGEKIKTWVGL